MANKPKTIHFFVNDNKIETNEESLTGTQIKQLAGVTATDLLEEIKGKEITAVNDDQVVEVKNKKFRTHPGGQDS